jgi:hypothetical protein
MLNYRKYFDVTDDILRQNGWEMDGAPDRVIAGQNVKVKIHKVRIVIPQTAVLSLNLELGEGNTSTNVYTLGYFSYAFIPIDNNFRNFRIENDSRQGLHANDDKGAHLSTSDGLELEKVCLPTYLGLVSEYLCTNDYPLDPCNFRETSEILRKCFGRVKL